MKHEDIVKMAKEYADEVTNGHGIVTYEFDAYGLEKFALLIRAVEREACAKLQPDLAKVGEVGVWGERQWQGLTDEEIDQAAWPHFIGNILPSVRLIVRQLEAKLKEKNAL